MDINMVAEYLSSYNSDFSYEEILDEVNYYQSWRSITKLWSMISISILTKFLIEMIEINHDFYLIELNESISISIN